MTMLRRDAQTKRIVLYEDPEKAVGPFNHWKRQVPIAWRREGVLLYVSRQTLAEVVDDILGLLSSATAEHLGVAGEGDYRKIARIFFRLAYGVEPEFADAV